MPWKGITVEELREMFCLLAMSENANISKLCEEYGISRTTGYNWINRAKNGGGFSDLSRKPIHSPNRIDPDIEKIIVDKRKKFPGIGAAKIHKMLENDGFTEIPSVRTINNIFQRNNLISPEASEAATHYKRFEKDAPNIMWQCDFKGDFLLKNGMRCFPLSVIDDCSRFCLGSKPQKSVRFYETKDNFEQIFREYGLPLSLLCDNGNPWGNSQTRCITQFEAWLMDLDVLVIHTRIKHPQCQGKVEHFNGSYKRESLKYYVPDDFPDAIKTCEKYRDFYNNDRPHHSLDLEVPSKIYVPSTIPYPDKIEEWEYEGSTELRKVKETGYISYAGYGFYLSEGMRGKTIGIMPTIDDGIVNVVYRGFLISKLDLRKGALIQRRIFRLHDDPRANVSAKDEVGKSTIDKPQAK